MNLPTNDGISETSNSFVFQEIENNSRKRIKLDTFNDHKWKIEECDKPEVLAEIGLGLLDSDNLNDSNQSDSNTRCRQQVITSYFPSKNTKRLHKQSMIQNSLSATENSLSPANKENDHDYLNCTNPLMVVAGNFNVSGDNLSKSNYLLSTEKSKKSSLSKCTKRNKLSQSEKSENRNMQNSSTGKERSPLGDLINSSFNRLSQTREIQNVQELYIYRKRNNIPQVFEMINRLSDEIVLSIFKWLPKQTLLRCSLVCKRWYRISQDESLWTRIDLGGKILPDRCVEKILSRGAVILRMAQSEVGKSLFSLGNLTIGPDFQSKLQYLDLSMAVISVESLNGLMARCRNLKKLSLEHVKVDDEICKKISENHNLYVLNLCMSEGITLEGIKYLINGCKQLQALNISWTYLNTDTVQYLCDNLQPNLTQLNIAGNRKTITDAMVETLVKNCNSLIDLDLSDCSMLTEATVHILKDLTTLEHLSLSRCYNIKPASYMIIHKYTSLMYLDIFGLMSEQAINKLSAQLPHIGINKFVYSLIARPTVGIRRTSIWGLRTRD